MKRKLSFILGLAALSCSTWADGIGTILVAVSKVVAQKEGQERILQRGSSVNLGDVITTDSHGSAQLKYSNGTLVSLGSSTSYQTVNYAPSSSGQQVQGKINVGSIKYQSTGKEKAIIQTPVVALAVLGTSFIAQVSNQNTYLKVLSGLVKGDNVILGPGQTYTSGLFGPNNSFKPNATPLYADFVANNGPAAHGGSDTATTVTTTTSIASNTTTSATVAAAPTNAAVETIASISMICPP